MYTVSFLNCNIHHYAKLLAAAFAKGLFFLPDESTWKLQMIKEMWIVVQKKRGFIFIFGSWIKDQFFVMLHCLSFNYFVIYFYTQRELSSSKIVLYVLLEFYVNYFSIYWNWSVRLERAFKGVQVQLLDHFMPNQDLKHAVEDITKMLLEKW